MTRSRRRKIVHDIPLASAVIAALPSAYAQNADGSLAEVVVTAQKREENLQKVPLSITAIGTAKLDELQVVEFTDYAKFLPSVAFQSLGPGVTSVYMRGVASGENSNHSGPLPSVGIYLDEQPITTITGALDVHVYDIARVEALAGPQGTLYGASSQAGTIRIITNKPDPTEFKASYDLTANTVKSGDPGYVGEGFVNIPLSEKAAIRIVGWARHDGGYIDNVLGSRTFPTLEAVTGNGTVTNTDRVEKNYNDVDTFGARAALKIDLNDSWTITPTIMGQKQDSDGVFGYDPRVGDLKVAHFKPEYQNDKWGQAALTVQGRVSNFDLVYAGAYLRRNVDSSADYSDYAYFYDVNYGYGAYIVNDAGDVIDPTQYFEGRDRYSKNSHELRISSDPTKRFRFVAGLFWQQQEHKIFQRYKIDDIGASIEVTGWEDTIWLTQQTRVDRDKAAFGEITYDITEKLSATAGMRYFKADNTLEGFFGYGLGYSGSTGEAQCDPDPANWVPYKGAPCKNLDKGIKENGHTPRYNLTYKFDDARLMYVTYSEGFRPGGINRKGSLPPYKADFLKNYEIGWKTSWANNRVRLNGAVFRLDWSNIQFSYLGQGGLTEIKNANDARIKGVEADINWAVTSALSLSGGFSYIKAELSENYCEDLVNGATVTDCISPQAVRGTRLPVSPTTKGNLTARYSFPLQTFEAHLQAAVVYQDNAYSDFTLRDRELTGIQEPYTIANFSGGIEWGKSSLELFVHNAFDERANDFRWTQCAVNGFDHNPACGLNPYYMINAPRTVGLRFGQRF